GIPRGASVMEVVHDRVVPGRIGLGDVRGVDKDFLFGFGVGPVEEVVADVVVLLRLEDALENRLLSEWKLPAGLAKRDPLMAAGLIEGGISVGESSHIFVLVPHLPGADREVGHGRSPAAAGRVRTPLYYCREPEIVSVP